MVQNPAVERVKQLENDVRVLSERLQSLQQLLPQQNAAVNGQSMSPTSSALPACHPGLGGAGLEPSSTSFPSPPSYPSATDGGRHVSMLDPNHPPGGRIDPLRSPSFKVRQEHVGDVVARNLVSLDSAVAYFQNFFTGCDRFVPVFDPQFDTFASVRARSTMLFDTICTVGCRMTTGPLSQVYQLLNKDSKSKVCEVLVGSVAASLESIQALLISASYSEKGWMLTSIATRMAIQLDLPGAYEEAVRFAAGVGSPLSRRWASDLEVINSEITSALFRKARTWLGLFVLEHIFSIDSGKPPGIEAQANLRRCRILVSHPSRTSLDLRLLSQVELNSLRAVAHSKLSIPNNLPDAELANFIQGMKIDLDIWLEDWLQIMLTRTLPNFSDRDTLILNLRVQRDWAEIVMCCRALQSTGIENIAAMSPEQHEMIRMAKDAAQRHLEKLLDRPDLYLATLRYSMDFVWAKCAFSVLLLLKLAILLPETSDLAKLLMDARRLLGELESMQRPQNIYYRILSIGIEKAEKALDAYLAQSRPTSPGPQDAEIDFQTYVPKEFMFEWDFPSLTLCFVPMDLQELFSEFTNM
jgi:hypothetical protein